MHSSQGRAAAIPCGSLEGLCFIWDGKPCSSGARGGYWMSVENKMTVGGCDTVLPQVGTTRCYWADKSLTSPRTRHSQLLLCSLWKYLSSQIMRNLCNLNFTHIYPHRPRPVFCLGSCIWLQFICICVGIRLEVRSTSIPSDVCTRHFASWLKNCNPRESP